MNGDDFSTRSLTLIQYLDQLHGLDLSADKSSGEIKMWREAGDTPRARELGTIIYVEFPIEAFVKDEALDVAKYHNGVVVKHLGENAYKGHPVNDGYSLFYYGWKDHVLAISRSAPCMISVDLYPCSAMALNEDGVLGYRFGTLLDCNPNDFEKDQPFFYPPAPTYLFNEDVLGQWQVAAVDELSVVFEKKVDGADKCRRICIGHIGQNVTDVESMFSSLKTMMQNIEEVDGRDKDCPYLEIRADMVRPAPGTEDESTQIDVLVLMGSVH